MSWLSVSQAASELGVSPARVRQRISDGSLVGQKVGEQWVVSLDSASKRAPQRGRPASPESVWWSLLVVSAAARNPRVDFGWQALLEVDSELDSCQGALEGKSFFDRLKGADSALDGAGGLPGMNLAQRCNVVVRAKHGASTSSRRRAVKRIMEALDDSDHSGLLDWLSNRAVRKAYRAAELDLKSLRSDPRLVLSGVSHPNSRMEDARVVEGYVANEDVSSLVSDYWLDEPGVDAAANVYLHQAPARPAGIDRLMLAADLYEHGSAREELRAHELLEEVVADLREGATHSP